MLQPIEYNPLISGIDDNTNIQANIDKFDLALDESPHPHVRAMLNKIKDHTVLTDPVKPLITIIDDAVYVDRMREEVYKRPENWFVNTTRQQYLREQVHTESIFLVQQIPEPNVEAWHLEKYEPTPLYDHYPIITEYLKQFAQQTNQKLARIAIVKLHEEVYAHVDYGNYYRTRNRYHLCIEGEYDYRVLNETKRIRAGTLFWFDNDMPHSAMNQSTLPRISIIFDTEPLTNQS